MIIGQESEPPRLTVEFGGKVDPVEAEKRRAQMARAAQ
jgi:hypothetical protein